MLFTKKSIKKSKTYFGTNRRGRQYPFKRKDCQKATTSCRSRKIKEKTKKAQKKPLSSSDLVYALCFIPDFIGVFSADELHLLKLKQFPCYFIVNTSESNISFGHWIAVKCSRTRIEIFDSLGGKPGNWGHYPKDLLKFLTHYSYSHNFVISPQLQSTDSQLCGLYCLYFILFRSRKPFDKLLRPFSSNFALNDLVISDLLLNYR